MSEVSDRINRLSESATLAMARMSRELKEEGKDVISLSLGEPDFETPEFIKEAAKKAINDNFSHYTPVPGLLDLRKSICKNLGSTDQNRRPRWRNRGHSRRLRMK